jgi:SAM-dependent methyltransferase
MFSVEFLHVIRDHEIRTILPYLTPGARILEIGGGTGYQAKLLAARGFEVTAIDLPNSNYRDHKVYPVIEYDGRHFPFPDNSFDIAFSSNLLEHVGDPLQLHRETARVLKPSGYAVHVVPTSAWRFWTIIASYVEMVERIILEFGQCLPRSNHRHGLRLAIHNARGLLRHYAVVPRHGETGNALTELVSFSATRWHRHFRAHRLAVAVRRPMHLFYTGHLILGKRMPLSIRSVLARFAGSACMMWVVNFPEKCPPRQMEPDAAAPESRKEESVAVSEDGTGFAGVAPIGEQSLFPRLDRMKGFMPPISTTVYEPAGMEASQRIRMLEAKVEYLLDELYRCKSLLRHLAPKSDVATALMQYQLSTFDYQWKAIPYHDEFLTNPMWRQKASEDVARRVDKPVEWFAGKKILDAGCGPGRHSWAFGMLGAEVTAFDMSDNGLEAARRDCAELPNIRFEKRNILEPLPYGSNFDLVWCYGVVHCTGDMVRALSNIARHVKPGGYLYIMVYAEPRRTNVYEYQYYHEIAALRDAIRPLTFDQKQAVLENLEGKNLTLAWFDAISSEINELYTIEELRMLFDWLGFSELKRTMPEETMHNVVARKSSG